MITGATKLVGIIGHPVAQSLSPVMHNAAFKEQGLDWAYLAFDVEPDKVPDAVAAIRALALKGVNVTMPYKSIVAPYLNEIDGTARIAESVNTIVNNKGKLEGYSTDGEGFLRAAAEEGVSPEDAKVFIVGAGGAARAIAAAISKAGAARVDICCRDADAAKKIEDTIRQVKKIGYSAVKFDGRSVDRLAEADIVINATPLGKENYDELTFLVDGLQPRHFVADLSTVPPLSAFLVAAQKRGCKAMGGLGMLVHQGAISYQLWTGREAPIEAMKRAVGA